MFSMDDLLGYINTNFGTAIALIVVIVFSLIAILRFGIKFDLNAYSESRKKRHELLARNACPHIRIGGFGESNDCTQISIESLFISPSGTLMWVCSKCGAMRYNDLSNEEMKGIATYYLEHPKEYKKAMKKFVKHAKKAC